MSVQKVDPSDIRYPDLVRGNNQRWIGSPDAVYLPGSADEVAQCVRELVAADQRFAVRSGGHCYENHVFNPDVRAVIDLSLMRRVQLDAGCIAVDAGQSLWDVYFQLHRRWGVIIPGGSCATVGAGGHITGAGYGLLSRRNGLTVDHLHGVEVVTADGQIRTVTRESTGDDLDLFWAHTGGGGGNFGVVTRFLLRSAGASGSGDRLLPRAPRLVLLHDVTIPWEKVGADGAKLKDMLRRFSGWCEQNAAATTSTGNLFALFRVFPRLSAEARAVQLTTQVAIDDGTDKSLTAARTALREFIKAVVTVDVPLTSSQELDSWPALPWLNATHGLGQGTWDRRGDYKSAYHRRLTAEHVAALVEVFAKAGAGADGARASLDTYGARVNAVAKHATATPHRDSAIKVQYFTLWPDQQQDQAHVRWLRDAYRTIYADTGGLPSAPNDEPASKATDGCFVNYLDDDLPGKPSGSTPAWWQLYYGANLARLVKVKARFDPHNVFHHAQSIPVSVPATGEV